MADRKYSMSPRSSPGASKVKTIMVIFSRTKIETGTAPLRIRLQSRLRLM